MFSVKELKELYSFFDGVDIGEIEFWQGDLKVKIVSGARRQAATPPAAPEVVQAVPVHTQEKQAPLSEPPVMDVTSKWVGVFTRLNPKTKEAYVKLRDVVKTGDVIAHIRVLGHLQDVVADQDGKIKEILVEEGQPVEYGQPLFRLEA